MAVEEAGSRRRAPLVQVALVLGLIVALVTASPGPVSANSPSEPAAATPAGEEAEVSSGRLEYAQHFRGVMGLSSDVDHIRTVEAADRTNNSEGRFGLALTDSELADLDRRAHVNGTTVPEIEEWGEDEHQDTFGGVFLDHAHAGIVRVRFTADIDQRADEVRQRWGDGVVVEPSRYTAQQLRGARAALDSARHTLRGEGINVVRLVDYVQTNSVEVQVDVPTATTKQRRDAARERVRGAAGGNDVTVTFGPEAAPANRLSDYTTLRGGLGIRPQKISNGHIMGLCTTGFNGFKDVAGTRQLWQITAGHCVPKAQRNPTPAGTVGTTTDVRFLQYSGNISRDSVSYYKISGATDAVVTRHDGRRGARGWVYTSPTSQSHPIQRTQSTSEDRTNDIVCHGGVTTTPGNNNTIVCGPITSRNVSFSLDGNWMHNMREANIPVAGGDSGSFVYGDQPDRNRYSIAQGIVAACGRTTSCPSSWVYYSHIGHVISEMGLHGILHN